MALIKCPDCGKEVSENAKTCIYCGAPINIGLEFELQEDGTYAVSGIGTCTDTDIVISSTYEGKSVTSIGYEAFYDCTNLTSVTIGNRVTSIRKYAFEDCTNLTSITIPDSVTFIGDCVFCDCTNLTSITIPDSVTTIGEDAFNGCTSLQYNEYDNGCYLGNENNPYLVLIEAKSEDITSCEINKNCKFIYSHAFEDCTSLTSITIPDSVTSIGYHAFYGCTSLTSITIPDSVTTIGDMAFENCTRLTTIYYNGTIEDWINIKNIDSADMFIIPWNYRPNCYSNFEHFYILDENGTIEYNDKKYNLLTEVVIPEGTTEIGDYAFRNFKDLTSITIPDSVTTIGDRAFMDCTSLTTITIPDSVTSIGFAAFSGCTSLKSIYYNGTIEDWINISGARPNNNLNFEHFYILDENGTIEYNGKKYSLLTELGKR